MFECVPCNRCIAQCFVRDGLAVLQRGQLSLSLSELLIAQVTRFGVDCAYRSDLLQLLQVVMASSSFVLGHRSFDRSLLIQTGWCGCFQVQPPPLVTLSHLDRFFQSAQSSTVLDVLTFSMQVVRLVVAAVTFSHPLVNLVGDVLLIFVHLDEPKALCHHAAAIRLRASRLLKRPNKSSRRGMT